MDASDHIARLRAGYAAFNAGDDAATVANIDPEIEVYEPPQLPDKKVWHGQEGYLAALRNMREVFGEISVEPEEFVELGDQVVVVARMVVRGVASGAEATLLMAHLWTVRGERAVRLEIFGSREDAMAAVRPTVAES